MDLEQRVLELEEQVKVLTSEIEFLRIRCNRLSVSKVSNDKNPYNNWAFDNKVSEKEINCIDHIMFVMTYRYKKEYYKVEIKKNSKTLYEIIENLIIESYKITDNMSESVIELIKEDEEINRKVVNKLRKLIFTSEIPCYQELKKIVGIVLKIDKKEFMTDKQQRFVEEKNKDNSVNIMEDHINQVTHDLLESIIKNGHNRGRIDMCKYLLEQSKDIH